MLNDRRKSNDQRMAFTDPTNNDIDSSDIQVTTPLNVSPEYESVKTVLMAVFVGLNIVTLCAICQDQDTPGKLTTNDLSWKLKYAGLFWLFFIMAPVSVYVILTTDPGSDAYILGITS